MSQKLVHMTRTNRIGAQLFWLQSRINEPVDVPGVRGFQTHRVSQPEQDGCGEEEGLRTSVVSDCNV